MTTRPDASTDRDRRHWAFLVREDVSYITGQVIGVNGGRTIA